MRRLRTWWTQLQCGYRGHGTLYVGRNRVSMFCRSCGWESDGWELYTARIRTLWMHEKHRLRWHGRMRRSA